MTEPDYDTLNRELDAKFEADIASISSGIDRLKADKAAMLAALMVAADTLKAFDPGDQSTETGWAHDEMFEAWKQCQAVIDAAQPKEI